LVLDNKWNPCGLPFSSQVLEVLMTHGTGRGSMYIDWVSIINSSSILALFVIDFVISDNECKTR